MSLVRKANLAIIDERWMHFKDGYMPRPGEAFVGRQGNTVYSTVFLMKEHHTVVYLEDESTVLSHPWDWFSDWMLVGIMLK